jgi:hypothetical protein
VELDLPVRCVGEGGGDLFDTEVGVGVEHAGLLGRVDRLADRCQVVPDHEQGAAGRDPASRANRDRTRKIYDSLRLELIYHHGERAVDVTAKPIEGLCVCPRGDLHTNHTPEVRRLAADATLHQSVIQRLIDPPRAGQCRDTWRSATAASRK